MLDTKKHMVQLVLVKLTVSHRVLLQKLLITSLSFSKLSRGVAGANFSVWPIRRQEYEEIIQIIRSIRKQINTYNQYPSTNTEQHAALSEIHAKINYWLVRNTDFLSHAQSQAASKCSNKMLAIEEPARLISARLFKYRTHITIKRNDTFIWSILRTKSAQGQLLIKNNGEKLGEIILKLFELRHRPNLFER